ncbi:hypothetical protein [Deinococcus navajonensis]|uniref:Uncharacterized protein n=1 Tax=Deinococcus navajonensis TaxID=309884 RepID=A0ABV8XQP8_9DEIO
MSRNLRLRVFLTGAALTATGHATPLLFDYPVNLKGYKGVCLVAGSPQPTVPVQAIERVVQQQLRGFGLPVERMDFGRCTPMQLKTGNGYLVMSVEVSAPQGLGAWLATVRVVDPHLVGPTGQTYQAALWEYTALGKGAFEKSDLWAQAARQFNSSWKLAAQAR